MFHIFSNISYHRYQDCFHTPKRKEGNTVIQYVWVCILVYGNHRSVQCTDRRFRNMRLHSTGLDKLIRTPYLCKTSKDSTLLHPHSQSNRTFFFGGLVNFVSLKLSPLTSMSTTFSTLLFDQSLRGISSRCRPSVIVGVRSSGLPSSTTLVLGPSSPL